MYHDAVFAAEAKADPRPRSAVSGGVGLAGLAGMSAWILVAHLYGMTGPYAALVNVAGLVVAAGRQGAPQSLDGDRLEDRQAMARDARCLDHQACGAVAHLGRDRADLWHRPLLVDDALLQFSLLDVVLRNGGPGAVRGLGALCDVARPAADRAQGRHLRTRRLADGDEHRGRSGGDPQSSAQLGGEGLLPRLHAGDRAPGLWRFRQLGHEPAAEQSGRAGQLLHHFHVRDRCRLRDRGLYPDLPAARFAHPHRQSLCRGLDGGVDLLSALPADGRWRPARLSPGHCRLDLVVRRSPVGAGDLRRGAGGASPTSRTAAC